MREKKKKLHQKSLRTSRKANPKHTEVNNDGPGVETLFQRYSDSQWTWTSGNHYSRCAIVSGAMGDRELEKVGQLFKDGTTDAYCWGKYSKVVLYKD